MACQTEQLPPGFTEKSATVNGVRINYKIGGQGPAVVLLHGYAETSHMWLPVMPQLATTHTVIVPDLRGAGNSERPQGWVRQEDHGERHSRTHAAARL